MPHQVLPRGQVGKEDIRLMHICYVIFDDKQLVRAKRESIECLLPKGWSQRYFMLVGDQVWLGAVLGLFTCVAKEVSSKALAIQSQTALEITVAEGEAID